MANVPVKVLIPLTAIANCVIAEWVLAALDVGGFWASADFTDRSIHVHDFTGAGNITVRGSNDPRVITDSANADWVTVKNDAGADCVYTADNKGDVIVAPYYFLSVTSSSTAAAKVHISGRRVK